MKNGERVVGQFLKDISGHRMDVIKDNGLYRHLKFSRPDSVIFRFDLLTWPGYLCICGDTGTYVFSRVPDMFQFFRGDSINPGYWSEKLESSDRNCGYEEYDPEVFERAVMSDFDQFDYDCPSGEEEGRKAKIWSEIQEEVLANRHDGECRALDAAMNFESSQGHTFCDFWEHRLKSYTYQFLWCCHAIVWGIKKYDSKEIDNTIELDIDSL